MSSTHKIGLCVVAGLLMSLWSPLNAFAIGGDEDDGMTPFGAFALFSTAVVVSSMPILAVLNRFGLVESVSWKLYMFPCTGDDDAFRGDRRWGIPGGFVWSVGFIANSLSGNALGFALSYSIGQSAPMVATLWGILYYREFEKAPVKSLHYVGLMFLLYIGAIVLIALS
jgi:glucose uptake protein